MQYDKYRKLHGDTCCCQLKPHGHSSTSRFIQYTVLHVLIFEMYAPANFPILTKKTLFPYYKYPNQSFHDIICQITWFCTSHFTIIIDASRGRGHTHRQELTFPGSGQISTKVTQITIKYF